ncbi:hypothetical protein ACLBKU_12080 [Erythrobacter sp. NE805]|uniref:hypothetical protein n=1 Tax=Erythrobacter sp. NE805 TaxID=3389875 RepID=UPI00396B407E
MSNDKLKVGGKVVDVLAPASKAQQWAEGTLPGGPGTKSAKEHAEDAAASAVTASQAAGSVTAVVAARDEALTQIATSRTNALADLSGAGTTQTTAVNSAGTTQVAAVNSAGNSALSAISGARSGALADLETARVAAVGDVTTAGTSQVAAVNSAGTAQVAAVNTANTNAVAAINQAGAAQLASVTAAGAASVPTLTDNSLTLRHQTIGAFGIATLASNVGVLQFGLRVGTDIIAGEDIAAMRWSWACASDTSRVEILVYERDVAAATTAGTLNNSGVVAQDTLIRTFNTTPSALNVTPGTSSPVLTRAYRLPTPITARTGFNLIFFFRNYNASNALVNCGFSAAVTPSGANIRSGYQAATATPTTFALISGGTARSAVVSVLGRRVPTAQAETVTNNQLRGDYRDEDTLSRMNRRNVQNLFANRSAYASSANTLSVPASFWGDSLVFDSLGGAPLADRALTIVGNLISGTINNYGINGQTASQITARVSAATSGEKAGLNYVMMGANDLPASKSSAAILADYATCAAAFTNSAYVMAATWRDSMRPRDRDVWRGLRSTYGANALDMAQVWARYSAGASDAVAARQAQIAAGFTNDNLHNNSAGCLVKGYEWAALTVARNGGAPYVHDDIIGMKNGDAAGTAIITPRVLGTAYNYTIIAGNDDDAVQIDRTTGAITRTGNAILQPYREVFVEAENNRGAGRNGRIIIVRQMDGTDPQSGVEVLGNRASYARLPSTYAPADGTGLTIVVCARLNLDRVNGNLIGQVAAGTSGVLVQVGASLRFDGRNAAQTSLGNVSLSALQPSDWNFYFFSIDTASVVRGSVNETTSSGSAPTAGNINYATINELFANSSNTLPFIGGIKMLWMANQYYDVHDSTFRNRFYDSTTKLPKDIGNDGTASGALAAPEMYLRGMAGDYILGKNFGTAGDLHVPLPLGRRHLGFTDSVS